MQFSVPLWSVCLCVCSSLQVRPMGLGGLKRNFDIYKWQRRVMEKERAVGGLERFVGSKGGSSIAAGDVGGGCSGSGSGV